LPSHAEVVLVVGLPGSGKSYVRQRLAAKLSALSVNSHSITDYVFAYRDFIHDMIMLGPPAGFTPHAGGGFIAPHEVALVPALRALTQAARDSMDQHEVTLVEFARADFLSAVQEFENLRSRTHIIHVSASAALRADRLNRRVEPPETIVGNRSVTLRLSDNHILPSAAARSLYNNDGIAQLHASRPWGNRIFALDNNVDDGGARIDIALDQFIDTILRPYQSGTTTQTHSPIPA
jgi:AAA domain